MTSFIDDNREEYGVEPICAEIPISRRPILADRRYKDFVGAGILVSRRCKTVMKTLVLILYKGDLATSILHESYRNCTDRQYSGDKANVCGAS